MIKRYLQGMLIIVAWLSISAIAFALSLAPMGVQAADNPNVVLMVADNVGYGDIGAFQGGEIRGMPTPSIDKLSAEGLTLTQFLTEPGCTSGCSGLGQYS